MERKPTVKVILLCYFAHTIDDVLGDLLHYMPASSYVNNMCPTTLYQPTTQTIPLFVFNFLIQGLFSNLAKQENSQLLLDVKVYQQRETSFCYICIYYISSYSILSKLNTALGLKKDVLLAKSPTNRIFVCFSAC